MAKFKCAICGYIYDDSKEEIAFKDLPDDWSCPICGAPKSVFEEMKEEEVDSKVSLNEDLEDLKELNYGEMSLLCQNLSKGFLKEYKLEEAKILDKFATKFRMLAGVIENSDLKSVQELLKADLNDYKALKKECEEASDRGALRAVVWNEKVSNMANAIISEYLANGDKYLDGKKIYVCEICGFIYIGNELPKVCPVCKVPNFKMHEVGVI